MVINTDNLNWRCIIMDYNMLSKPLNRYFDHTLLKPDATEAQILELCREALAWDFYSVCVNPCYVSAAAEALRDSPVKTACVCGFPLGATDTASKVFEAVSACKAGASEIDMVMNVGMLKSGNFSCVAADIKAVTAGVSPYGAIVKVILETCLLTDDEVVKACQISKDSGAAFVKTSTGFGSSGATAHHVKLMRNTVGQALQVKASGGIRDLAAVMEMIEAGADRIGASASVSIMEEYKRSLEK